MYLDNITRYVSTGSMFNKDEKAYRKNSFGPVALTIMAGIVPGVVLKGYWGYMSLATVIVSLACVITTFKLSAYGLTLQDSLCLDVVIYGAWIINISIIELMYFTIWQGFNPWFLLIYLPVVLIPLFFGIKIYKLLKSENYNPKKAAKTGISSVGFTAGILGACFAGIFKNIEQSTAFIVILICLSLLNGFMSLGMISLQKLYYIKKYKISV